MADKKKDNDSVVDVTADAGARLNPNSDIARAIEAGNAPDLTDEAVTRSGIDKGQEGHLSPEAKEELEKAQAKDKAEKKNTK